LFKNILCPFCCQDFCANSVGASADEESAATTDEGTTGAIIFDVTVNGAAHSKSKAREVQTWNLVNPDRVNKGIGSSVRSESVQRSEADHIKKLAGP